MTISLRAAFAGAALGITSACTPAPVLLDDGKFSRPLTQNEIGLLQSIFADQVDYHSIRIHKSQATVYNRAYNNDIYMIESVYYQDYAKSNDALVTASFVHEVTHVWQHQNGTNLVPAAVGLFFRHGGNYSDAYIYTWGDMQRFPLLSIEQQGAMVQDYYYFNTIVTAETKDDYCPSAIALTEALRTTFPKVQTSPACR